MSVLGQIMQSRVWGADVKNQAKLLFDSVGAHMRKRLRLLDEHKVLQGSETSTEYELLKKRRGLVQADIQTFNDVEDRLGRIQDAWIRTRARHPRLVNVV